MALVMAQINIVDIALVMALMYMAQVDMALVMALMYMAQVDMALVMTPMYMAQEDMALVMAPLVMTLTMEDINVISWDLTNSLKMIERKRYVYTPVYFGTKIRIGNCIRKLNGDFWVQKEII